MINLEWKCNNEDFLEEVGRKRGREGERGKKRKGERRKGDEKRRKERRGGLW